LLRQLFTVAVIMILKAKHLVKHLQDMIKVYGDDVSVTIFNGDHCLIEDVVEENDSICDAMFGGKPFLSITTGGQL